MPSNTVEIAGDRRHLCKERGFLAIYSQGERLGRLPLDDLGVVLVAGHGITYTNELLVALAERCVPLFMCNRRMLPVGFFWSLDGHHLSGRRIRNQADAGRPLQKRLWQQIIKAKIGLQAQVLRRRGGDNATLINLARRVKSGDLENLEAAAARFYWREAFGPSFRRRRDRGGANALLNYAYTIIRSAASRAVMLAGLHPAFSIFHHNSRNSMPLVDDLMEPYRPFADLAVLELLDKGCMELDKNAKQELCNLPNLDLVHADKLGIVSTSLLKCTASLAEIYQGKRREISLPQSIYHSEKGPAESLCNDTP